VVQLDEALRSWMFKGLMCTTAPVNDVGSWLSWSLQEVQDAMRGLVLGRHGMLVMRAAEELPPVVRLRPEGSETDLPVVSVEEVERTRPELAEVLQRWRSRRPDQGLRS